MENIFSIYLKCIVHKNKGSKKKRLSVVVDLIILNPFMKVLLVENMKHCENRVPFYGIPAYFD